MADNQTNAMADTSKKNCSYLKKGNEDSSLLDANIPLSTNVDKSIEPKSAAVTYEELESIYSKLGRNANPSSVAVIAPLHFSPTEKINNGSSSNRKFACILVTVIIIIFAIVFACLLFVLAEITKLNSEAAFVTSEIASSSQMPSSQQYSMIMVLLERVNKSISFLVSEKYESLQLLTHTIVERIMEQHALLNNSVNMLDERITLHESVLEGKYSTFPVSLCLPPIHQATTIILLTLLCLCTVT